MEIFGAEIPDAPDASGDRTAIERLRERLFLAPRDAGTMRDLAALLETTGDFPGAIDLLQRALRVDPYQLPVLLDLARLWAMLADIDRARSWFERALAIDPDSAAASAGLAALAGTDMLTPTYIRTLFDQYADRFDDDLNRTLKYQAPELVAGLLGTCGVANADILDLGCGTGLSGKALHPFARRLDGVDLSPGMIAKARLLGLYDDLAVDEALAYLERATRRWDAVAAVDMLNYLGDLTPIFAGAAARLNPDGWLVGTVEKRAAGGTALTAKRRYTHGADHVSDACLSAGLTLRDLAEVVLRHEGGAPVAGLVFAAQG